MFRLFLSRRFQYFQVVIKTLKSKYPVFGTIAEAFRWQQS